MKNRKIVLLIILIILFAIVSTYFINEHNSKIKTADIKYVLPIKYLIVDKEKTKDNVTINEIFEKSDSGVILFSSLGSVPLEKKGNYYIGKLESNINPMITKNISDYVFALNDIYANVKNDIEFNEKTYEIKIPKKYIKDISEASVHMQILTRMTKNDIANIDIDVFMQNKKEKNSKNDIYELETEIAIKNYKEGKKINKSDISIYINDNKYKISSDNFKWNSKSGVITLSTNPMFIKNVNVIIKNQNPLFKIIDFIMNLKSVNAYDIDAYKKMGTAPSNVKVNDKFTFTLSKKEYVYDPAHATLTTEQANDFAESKDFLYGDGYYNNATKDSDKIEENWMENYNTTAGTSTLIEYLVKLPTSVEETFGSGDNSRTAKITFPANTWIALMCGHSEDMAAADADAIPMVVEVLEIAGDEIVLFFHSSQKFSNQYGYGIYKFYWKDNGRKKVQKVDENGTKLEASGIKFKLYQGSSCGGKVKQTKTTNDSGIATFKNLTCNKTYSVKESSLGTLSANNYKSLYQNECMSLGTVDCSGEPDASGYFTKTHKYINLTRKYCLKVKKEDAEDKTKEMKGYTFNGVTDGSPADADGSFDGIVTFANLPYGTYNITEDNADGDGGYWNDANGKPTTSVRTLTITTTDADEMIYDANGKPTSCGATTSTYIKTNHKQYYCVKVKKVDAIDKTLLKGASFKISNAVQTLNKKDSDDGAEDGIASFFVGTDKNSYTVTEVTAPTGYALNTKTFTATPVLLPRELSYSEAKTACEKADAVDHLGNSISAQATEVPDSKLVLNWFKTTENGETKANGAKFKVKNNTSNKYVQVNGFVNQTDANGVIKTCYKYSSMVDESSASVLDSMNTATNNGTTNGETCIAGLSDGTYKVTETQPVQYHTFNSYDNITITAQTTFAAMGPTNKFINSPTRFVFTKAVDYGDETDELKALTTRELTKLKFNVFDSSNNQPLSFVLKDGIYQYTGNTIDGPGTTGATTELQLNDNRQITIENLPWGTYNIKEQETDGCVDSKGNACSGNGFYYPEYSKTSDYQFVISQNSSDEATIKSGKNVVQSLTNTPTEITFTKDDLYKYIDEKDIVKFENEEEVEVEAFDDITFRLKDAQGNYLSLLKIKDGEYRYTKGVGDNLVTDLHTVDGTFKITHLCRASKYVIEEFAVPEGTIFILPEPHPEVTYNIPIKSSLKTETSNTQVIDNTATRVRFEKRDSKYNYLIPDETTTFQVYRCKKGTECHPTDENDENSVLVKFSERAVIENTKEDKEDAEGLAGVEVYKFLTTSDEEAGTEGVTDLHPYKGILVLRYLPANYDYVLVETVAPKNYTLPEGRNAETKFTVLDNTVEIDQVDVPNKPTSLLIRKYSDDGELLEGAEFKIYEGTTCDANLSPMNQPKKALKLKTIRDGVYESRPETDTDTIITCTDREDAKCSDISVNNATKLTYNNYLGTYADFDDESTKTEDGIKIELQEGEALVQYLEYGHCYIIEEVKAPKGYSLPKNTEDRFTMVTIKENDMYAHDTMKDLINKPTPFTFYKYDEFNQLLDGAEFKLQKLDQNKKYQDVTVTREEKDDKVYYKVDEETDNTVITTINGSATVYYLEAGQYRIVETKPAPGKELNKNPNVATFFIDDSGNSYGNAIIVNKPKTDKIEIKNSATAELIVNIQTGQTVIKYGLIIAVLVALLSGLMIIRKKMK